MCFVEDGEEERKRCELAGAGEVKQDFRGEIYDRSGESPANQRAANCSAARAQPEPTLQYGTVRYGSLFY
jgi:hypothetical protein